RCRVRTLVEVGLGQLDLDLVRHQRRRDHENDQQHQHHVDQRHDVDRGVDLVVAAVTARTEGHVGSPSSVRVRDQRESPTRAPVAKKSCRSWAKVSSFAFTPRFSRTKKLYASTAGIATPRPIAVMISASPTGPATEPMSAWPLAPMRIRA